MYLPSQFEETSVEVMHSLMRRHPLATLVALTDEGLNANHIPLYVVAGSSAAGLLQGHVARANPFWKTLKREVEALAIFQGPQAYISPSWYPSKAETGKVVPTWNYAVVHAYGRLEIHDDPAWIRRQMEALTRQQESGFPAPWAVSDAPPDFTEKMIGAVVGIEMAITRLVGKSKVSQNQPAPNRQGVIAGLQDRSGEAAQAMAQLVRERSRDAG